PLRGLPRAAGAYPRNRIPANRALGRDLAVAILHHRRRGRLRRLARRAHGAPRRRAARDASLLRPHPPPASLSRCLVGEGGDLAHEQERDERRAIELNRRAHERVVEDDAFAVAGILGERGAAFQQTSAEHAARHLEALLLFVALGPVPLEDVEEARAVLGLV